MCDYANGDWRCDVYGGAAEISERTGYTPYGIARWTVRARIPLSDAVGIAKQLMAHRKRAAVLAPEADAMEAG